MFADRLNKILASVLIWRAKHISTNNFVLILSILVGIAGGLAAALLKTVVHYIQTFLFELREVITVQYLYLVFPLIGLLLTVS